MSKVFVTGGAGFIGSHLTDELVRQGYQVVVLDDLSTGKKENIEPLIGNGNAMFIKGSVTDLPLMRKLLQNVECVFHLAAIASVPRSVQDPLSSHNVNVTGTFNLLLAAKENKVKKVVYISSSAVYGDTVSVPQKEDINLNPKSPYAITKLTGEHYCKTFYETYGLNTICLRYFNVYGPRQHYDSQYAAVIPIFISNALAGKPPVIFGDGEQTRDFVFVKDAVQAALMAAKSDATGIFNVGTGKAVSVNEIAKLVLKITGKDLKPVYQGLRSGDIIDSSADISKARSLGYEPKYTLEEGLIDTIRRSRNGN
jgi:UDP-glucose 4-epimerase